MPGTPGVGCQLAVTTAGLKLTSAMAWVVVAAASFHLLAKASPGTAASRTQMW